MLRPADAATSAADVGRPERELLPYRLSAISLKTWAIWPRRRSIAAVTPIEIVAIISAYSTRVCPSSRRSETPFRAIAMRRPICSNIYSSSPDESECSACAPQAFWSRRSVASRPNSDTNPKDGPGLTVGYGFGAAVFQGYELHGATGGTVSGNVAAVALILGAALLAGWVDFRFPKLSPETFTG